MNEITEARMVQIATAAKATAEYHATAASHGGVSFEFHARAETLLAADVLDLCAAVREARGWVRRLSSTERMLTCAFCGEAYPPGTPESNHEALTAHVKVCPKHPMREVERERDAMRAKIRTVQNAVLARATVIRHEEFVGPREAAEALREMAALLTMCAETAPPSSRRPGADAEVSASDPSDVLGYGPAATIARSLSACEVCRDAGQETCPFPPGEHAERLGDFFGRRARA